VTKGRFAANVSVALRSQNALILVVYDFTSPPWESQQKWPEVCRKWSSGPWNSENKRTSYLNAHQ